MAPKIPLTPEVAQKAFEAGLLDKEFMDKVYTDLSTEEAVDASQALDVVSNDIAAKIKQTPEASALAQAVADKLTPQPTPSPAPRAQVVAPTPAARVQATPTALPMPTGTVAPTQSVGQAPVVVEQMPAEVVPTKEDYSIVADIHNQNASQSAAQGNASGVLSEAEKAINTIKQGYIQEAAAVSGTAANIQSAYADAVGKMEAQAKDFSVRNAELMKGYDASLAKQQEAIDQFSGEKLDPNRWWGSRSLGEKVLSTISVALSAATGTGASNKALDIITRAIDRDIQIQKDQIAIKKESLDSRDSFLSKISSRVNSEAQAENLTRAYMLDQVKSRVEMASVQGEAAKAQAQLLQNLGDLQLKAIKAAQEFAVADVNAGISAADGGVDLPVLDENANYLELNKKYKGQAVPNVGIARTKEAAGKAAMKVASYKAVKSDLDKLEALIGKYGVETLPSSARVQAKTMAKNIFLKIKSAEGFGALDKGSVEFGQGMITDDPLGSRGLDVFGIGSRVGNMVAGENPSLTQVKEMKRIFSSQFKNNLAVDLLAVSPRIQKELIAVGKEDFANQNAKSVGKAVTP
jgi:hypothetical protein